MKLRAASSLLCALPLVVQGGPATKPAKPAPKPTSYPFELAPVDAIYGHLSQGLFSEPIGVHFDAASHELFVADSKNGLIGIYDAERTPLFAFGGPTLLVEPRSIDVAEDGTIYVLDAAQLEIRVFNYRGEPRQALRFARPGHPEGQSDFLRVTAFTRDGQGGWIVADQDEARVLGYDRDLRFAREFKPSVRAKAFHYVIDLAVSPRGLVAAIDMQGMPAIHVYDSSAKLLAAFGERDVGLKDFTAPAAVAFDEQGFLYAVDLLRHDVKVFTSSGEFVWHFGGWFSPQSRGRGPGELLYPMDIAIDPQGPVYIAERFGQRVQVFQRSPRADPASGQRVPEPAPAKKD